MNTFSVFISHDSRDQTLAELLKDLIEQIFLNSEVFVSGKDLVGGDLWVQEIRAKLQAASAIIALITPLSRDNAWVLFESGVGFVEGKTIPLIAGGIGLADLPAPFQMLQTRLYNQEGLKRLLVDVANLGKVRTPSKFPGLEATVSDALGFLELREANLSENYEIDQDDIIEVIERRYDPELIQRYNDLVAKTQTLLIRSIKKAEASANIPTEREMLSMRLWELAEVARHTNIPYPTLDIVQLQLLGLSIPFEDSALWKKLNADKELSRLENEINRFEKSL